MGRTRWRMARLAWLALVSAIVAVVLAQAASASSGGRPAARPGIGGAPAPRAWGLHRASAPHGRAVLPRGSGTAVPVGLFPFGAALDPGTRTLYVANDGENTLSLIDARACNAARHRGCRRAVAAIPVPSNPIWVALDRSTHTLYVTIGGATDNGHTVVVLDAGTCNARTRSDCRVVATVNVGTLPVVEQLDAIHHTVYVANILDNTLSMIDVERCNATVTSGCAGRMPTVPVGAGPDATALDPAHHSLYVGNADDATVSVIDTSVCNARRLAGCHGPVATAAVGDQPFWVTVDPAVHTAYVVSNGTFSVSMIDTRTCSATAAGGCSRPAPTTPVGASPTWAGLDRRTHTIYVTNSQDATLSVLDTSTCNTSVTAGCGRGPTLRVGWNPQTGYVDAVHRTIYVVNNIGRSVSVVGSSGCNANRTAGCRRQVPTAPTGAFPVDLALDRSTNTVYVSNADGTMSLLDGASCNADDRSGCRSAGPTIPVPAPDDLVVDRAHHTLYVSNVVEHGTVTMIDTATCHARRTGGCREPHPTVAVGSFPVGLALNPRTHTLYVADSVGTMTVIDTRACNAHHPAGCRGPAPTIAIPEGAFRTAIDRLTDTIYVGQYGTTAPDGTLVAVVDGSACNATHDAGCGRRPATITVAEGITGLLVDEATRTLYVAHHDPTVFTGVVSVVDIARCNGATTTGCHARPTDVLAAYAPVGLALDPRTHRLYVTGAFDSNVWILDVGRCTGSDQRGCGTRPRLVEVGSTPHAAELDPTTGTLYAPNVVDGDVSLVPLVAR